MSTVLLVPGYWYLCRDKFLEVAEALKSDHKIFLLEISDAECSIERFNEKNNLSNDMQGIPVFRVFGSLPAALPDSSDAAYSSKLGSFSPASNFYYAILPEFVRFAARYVFYRMRNFYYLIRKTYHYFYKFTKPLFFFKKDRQKFKSFVEKITSFGIDTVIINSDLGSFDRRFFILAAEHCGVRIIILLTTDIEKQRDGLIDIFLRKFFDLIKIDALWYYQLRATYFRTNVIGSLARSAIYLDDGNIFIKSAINSRAIDVDRVKVIKSFSKSKNAPSNINNKNNNLFVITFFTECLHEVYSYEEVIKSYKAISKHFSRLCSEFSNVKVIVRPHPREIHDPQVLNDFIMPFFSGFELVTEPGIPVINFIESSNLCVAHYSKALIDSFVASKPFCSLGFNGVYSKNSFYYSMKYLRPWCFLDYSVAFSEIRGFLTSGTRYSEYIGRISLDDYSTENEAILCLDDLIR